MAIENLITDHLDLWTAAVRPKSSAGRGSNSKLELTGIKKLRELILELAVRGKLVPQDPSDEPASVLLARIAAEKDQLVKAGQIKKPKPLPEIGDEEKPFELPEGWEVSRLGDLINVINGRAYKKHEMLNEGTPLLRVGNLFTSNEWYYSDLNLEPEKYIDTGDLIYSWSASFGPFIWDGGKVIYHYHIWKMDIFDELSLDKYFMKLYLESVSASIKASGNGIAMIHMTKERMEKLVIPLPPQAEQHRIVAKVDELMALCDQLEQQSEAALAAHQILVEALLATLTDSGDAAELAQNWARLSVHFDNLFTTEASIDALKQTILQLAVMGKLVPKDPSDEPASTLLERIAAEKTQLINAGTIKNQRSLPPINDDEKPFELPEGWEWCRVGNVATLKGGFAYKSGDFISDGDFQVIRMGNIRPDNLRLTENPAFIPESLADQTRDYMLAIGDILITMTGTKGKRDYLYSLTIRAEHLVNRRLFLNQRLCQISPIILAPEFVNLVLKDERILDALYIKSTGTANQANIGMDAISNCLIPVPPLSSQKQIISKYQMVILICDQLKARLQTSQQTQLALAETLVEQGLNG